MKALLPLLLPVLAFAAPDAQEPKPAVRALPEFRLTAVTVDKTREIEKKDLLGKVWVVSFMFTRCSGPCPLNSVRMQRLQKKLPGEVMLASFTVDPKNDQEQALRRYAKQFRARPDRWMFLTAPDEETLIPVFKDAFHTAYKPSDKAACGFETFHSAKFFLIDRRGDIRGEYVSEDPEELKRLERDALELAAAGADAPGDRPGSRGT